MAESVRDAITYVEDKEKASQQKKEVDSIFEGSIPTPKKSPVTPNPPKLSQSNQTANSTSNIPEKMKEEMTKEKQNKEEIKKMVQE